MTNDTIDEKIGENYPLSKFFHDFADFSTKLRIMMKNNVLTYTLFVEECPLE